MDGRPPLGYSATSARLGENLRARKASADMLGRCWRGRRGRFASTHSPGARNGAGRRPIDGGMANDPRATNGSPVFGGTGLDPGGIDHAVINSALAIPSEFTRFGEESGSAPAATPGLSTQNSSQITQVCLDSRIPRPAQKKRDPPIQ